jgi:hypothetical protein
MLQPRSTASSGRSELDPDHHLHIELPPCDTKQSPAGGDRRRCHVETNRKINLSKKLAALSTEDIHNRPGILIQQSRENEQMTGAICGHASEYGLMRGYPIWIEAFTRHVTEWVRASEDGVSLCTCHRHGFGAHP